MPAVEEIVITRPERWARSSGRAARVTLTGPNRVVSIWERKFSGVIFSKKPAWKFPALLTRTSSRPNRSTVAFTAAVASAGSVTSRSTGSSSSCSPRAFVMDSALRAVATTAWPAARAALAMSTPRPRPAPVMNQTFFSLMSVLFLRLGLGGRGSCRAASSPVAPTTKPAASGRLGDPARGVPTGTPGPARTARRVEVMAEGNAQRDVRGDVRAQIREFLSTRRARISPEQAGLPVYGGHRRRVPGLRRSEVASLAGISPEYMTKLERGDAT